MHTKKSPMFKFVEAYERGEWFKFGPIARGKTAEQFAEEQQHEVIDRDGLAVLCRHPDGGTIIYAERDGEVFSMRA